MKNRLQNAAYLAKETSRLTHAFPDLSLRPLANGAFLVHGTIEIISGILYTVRLRVPPKYPEQEPILVCNSREVPFTLDRHVYPGNGIACLCVAGETRIHWPEGSDLTDFVEKLVKPFFIGQFYYDKHGCWPATGQRHHGRRGIIEAYSEIFSRIPNITEEQIENLLTLLARNNDPAGHEPCPCRSGLRLRHCHRDLVRQFRGIITPRHARHDRAILLRKPTQNAEP